MIREALEKRKMAGLSSIVLYRRERPAVIEAFGKGMLLTTLRYDMTVRQPDSIFEDIPDDKPDADMVEMATSYIDKKMGKFDPKDFEDEYANALLKLIKARKSGHKPRIVKAEPDKPSNVVNLFDALKKSLAGEDDDKGKPASSGRRASPKASSKGTASRSRGDKAR